MTRRSLFQVAAAAFGALLFPRTAASALEPVITAEEALPSAVPTMVPPEGLEDDLYGFYLGMARELEAATARTQQAEIMMMLGI